MDRRQAIKSISLSTGLVISSGTFFSMLQSCQQSPTIDWTPRFFSKEDAAALSEIAETILPATDLPGAKDVAAPQLIDLLVKDVFKPEEQEKFAKGFQLYLMEFNKAGGRDAQKAFVEKSYAAAAERGGEFVGLAKSNSAPAGKENEYHRAYFMLTVRDLTLRAYFTSEQIGENVLSYDPVPGEFSGCIPVEQVGNIWSLS